jgi:hypothetical protein
LELSLPLQDAGASGGGFSLRNVAGLLQGDRKRGVGERVSRCEDGKRQCGGDGFVKMTGVAQGANEAVMGFNMGWIGGDGGSKGLGRLRRLTGSEKIESLVGKRVGRGEIGHGWF